jgi:hypothetical protein
MVHLLLDRQRLAGLISKSRLEATSSLAKLETEMLACKLARARRSAILLPLG